ncbi:MAG: TRAP transporter large permease subunit [Lachnospiraceae bacterium]|nr:TRAP transporter large permease subunit [Lachnospiraceae bacterium]
MSAETLKITALIIFIAVYVLLVAVPSKRPYIAIIAAIVFVFLGIMPISKVSDAINWNVLMMLAGTMGTVSLFIESKMPNRLADMLLKLTPNVMWVAVVMSLFAGVVSAFVDNVATVLMIAPVGLAIAKRMDISPVPMLISISVSSNLQGAATLVGDTTSIMLGGYANMDFMDFFFMQGRFSIFWAVELGALATIPVIMFIFRKNRQKVESETMTEATNHVPGVLLVLTVVLLIAASFIPNKPELTNGIICMAICIIGLIHAHFSHLSTASVVESLKEIDFETLFLLAGLFVVIGGITNVGIIKDISNIFINIGGDNLFIMYTLIVFGSVIFSAFIDNIPYVATMLPVVQGIALTMGVNPILLYFGLLCGATLGGNLTPIGASANIVTIGLLRKNGYNVKTSDFLKIGVPFTLVAVVVGYLFCWFVWA